MEDRLHSFEDLSAWKCARELVRLTYEAMRNNAAARDFGLRDQIQRAAVSAMTNIAEGFERVHLQEKIQFYRVARASCGEVRSLTYVLLDAGYATPEQHTLLQDKVILTGKLISGLLAATEKRKP